MNFRQLEYFTTAARLKSISKAAQELHVAPATCEPPNRTFRGRAGSMPFPAYKQGNRTDRSRAEPLCPKQAYLPKHTHHDRQCAGHWPGAAGLLETWIDLFHYFFHLGFSKEISCGIPQCRVLHPHGNSRGSFERSEQWRSSRDISPGTTSEISGSWERILGEETLEVILTESLDPAPGLDYIPIERLRDVPMWPAAQRWPLELQQLSY